jgi:hypothetical protein
MPDNYAGNPTITQGEPFGHKMVLWLQRLVTRSAIINQLGRNNHQRPIILANLQNAVLRCTKSSISWEKRRTGVRWIPQNSPQHALLFAQWEHRNKVLSSPAFARPAIARTGGLLRWKSPWNPLTGISDLHTLGSFHFDLLLSRIKKL